MKNKDKIDTATKTQNRSNKMKTKNKDNIVLIPEVLPPEGEQVKPPSIELWHRNFFGNKYIMLAEIADGVAMTNPKTVLDLCSGTGLVSYYLKYQGYRVIANDIMRYPCIRLKALLENQTTTLSEEDLDMLCSRKRGRLSEMFEFYQRTFGKKNSRFLHAYSKNIQKLDDPCKRDIAVYIAVVSMESHFKYGAIHWNRKGVPTGNMHLRDVNLESEIRRYSRTIFPKLLFDNGKENKVYNEDIIELLPNVEGDVATIDLPYCANGGQNYEMSYSSIDDWVRLISGEGDKIEDPTDGKCELAPYHSFRTRTSSLVGMSKIFARSQHILHLIFCYNSTSKITPNEIAELAASNGRKVAMGRKHVQLAATKKSSPNRTYEYLIHCLAEDACKKKLSA